jgi:hypothetical protein
LAELARQFGIAGWKSLTKDALIAALNKAKRSTARRAAVAKPAANAKSSRGKSMVAKPVTSRPAKPAARTASSSAKPAKTAGKPSDKRPATPNGSKVSPAKKTVPAPAVTARVPPGRAASKGLAAGGAAKPMASKLVVGKSKVETKAASPSKVAAAKPMMDRDERVKPVDRSAAAKHGERPAPTSVAGPSAVKSAVKSAESRNAAGLSPSKAAPNPGKQREAKSAQAAIPKPASSLVESGSRPAELKAPAAIKKPLPRPAKAPPPPKPTNTPKQVVQQIERLQLDHDQRKDLSSVILVSGQALRGQSARTPAPRTATPKEGDTAKGAGKPRDRIILIVRDSFWLHAQWEISRHSVERAKASMAEHWHTARPVLRLSEVDHGASANASERVIRDILIHGGVNTWYIDVADPPHRFRVSIGYLAANGKFHVLCRSNIVQTPSPGTCDVLDGHWRDIAENYERIYALSGGYDGESGSEDLREVFEERLHREVGGPGATRRSGHNSGHLRRDRDLPFEVDAELIIYGSTDPTAYVTLAGEPVKLRSDGTFTVRMDLPDKRQVLPVVAATRDGLRQRTTVVAVERNTKVMEPIVRDEEEE